MSSPPPSDSHPTIRKRSRSIVDKLFHRDSTASAEAPPPLPDMRKVQRSYSQSHAHSYVATHSVVPALGQGATVVRTPQDATMFMAQPGALAGPWPLSRGASLRDTPRRPSDEAKLPDHLAPTISGPPLLPPVETSPFTSDLRNALSVNELKRIPSPPRMLARTPSAPSPHTAFKQSQSRAAVDTSSGYQPGHHVNTRTSCSNIHATASPSRPTLLSSPPSVARRNPYTTDQVSPRSSPTIIPERSKTHASRPSVDTIAPLGQAPAPVAPILVSHTVRPSSESQSIILVTLRFGFSLDAEPNTHPVTVTFDTLRPAGGHVVEFLDKVIRPPVDQSRDSGIGGSGSGTPSNESAENAQELLTDTSSIAESDFEYDDYPSVGEESNATKAPPRPARRQYPPTAFNYNALPPLADLPAALAHAKAAVESKAAADKAASDDGHSPHRRKRASTYSGPAVGMVTEIVILLQRDASAWHAIASRLCSGQWPSLDGRRRRVEDECRWAGMEGLLGELRAPLVVRAGRGYI